MSTAANTAPRDRNSIRQEAHRFYDEARRMTVRGNWEEAITLFDQAITVDPSYAATYEGRAAAYHVVGRHEEAIRDYSHAIGIRQDSPPYTQRGRVYLEEGRHLQGDQDYHQALSAGLPSLEAYIGMGDAHRLMADLEGAVRDYSQATALDPDSWRAYYFRGICYFRLRLFQRALEDFDRVIVLQPHNPGAYFARGAAQWLSGQCVPALVDLRAFVALSDSKEVISKARGHIEHLNSMKRCEPPPDMPLVTSMHNALPVPLATTGMADSG